MSCQRWKNKEKNNRNNPQNEPNIVKRLSQMRPIIEINRKWLVTTAWKYAKELRIDHLDNVIHPINRG